MAGALTLALDACDEDGAGGGGDPCAEAAAIEDKAVAAYCKDKDLSCCYCQCFESHSGLYDVAELLASGTCVCVTPPGSPNECTDGALGAAEICLDDEASCGGVAALVAEALCGQSGITATQ